MLCWREGILWELPEQGGELGERLGDAKKPDHWSFVSIWQLGNTAQLHSKHTLIFQVWSSDVLHLLEDQHHIFQRMSRSQLLK